MREPRLPTGAPGTKDGFLGMSGLGDFSLMTSIFGAAGFSSGALISGTFGVGCMIKMIGIFFLILFYQNEQDLKSPVFVGPK